MKRALFFTLLLSCSLSLAFFTGACRPERLVSLKFNPPQDKQFEFVMEMDQDIEMEQMGQKINMKNLVDFTYDMLVKSKDGKGNTEMVSTFKKIKFSMKAAEMNIDYNSESPDTGSSNIFSNMIGKAFSNMIGKSISVMVNEKGEVISVKGMQAIFDGMIESLGLDTIPGAKSIVENLKTQYSDDKFKSNFESMFRILPDKEVNVGDTWDITMKKDLMSMGVETKTTYTLEDMNDKNAFVALSTNLDVTNPGSGLGGAEMKMTGKQTGTMKIDIATGLPVQGEMKQDITATTQSGGQEIPMKIKGTIRISSREK